MQQGSGKRMSEPLEGHVARLVTADELILNLGEDDGVDVGMEFIILDKRAMGVKDPITGADLGSIKRRKATVKVIRVAEHLALARDTHPQSNLGAIGLTLSGMSVERTLQGESWQNGVQV